MNSSYPDEDPVSKVVDGAEEPELVQEQIGACHRALVCKTPEEEEEEKADNGKALRKCVLCATLRKAQYVYHILFMLAVSKVSVMLCAQSAIDTQCRYTHVHTHSREKVLSCIF